MDSELLKTFLRLGIFIGGGGLVLAFFQPAGSAELVLSMCSAMMGGVVVLGAVLVSRWRSRGARP